MNYAEALEAQVAALGHMDQLARVDGEPTGETEREISRILEYGDTYYWSSSLGGVVQSAAEDLPENWQWTPEHLPTPEGFLWFAHPLIWETGTTHDERFVPHPPFRLRALGWSTGAIRETGEGVLNVVAFSDGQRHLTPLLVVQVKRAQSIAERLEDGSMLRLEGRYRSTAGCMLVTIGACLTFLQQRIFVAPQQRAERHARRRLERQGYQHEPLIRVVELRRKQTRSEHHGDSDPVAWSCQWIVSGHWRQQWYPTLNTNQPRWIMPYVKGDPTQPLKPPRAKVFAVTR